MTMKKSKAVTGKVIEGITASAVVVILVIMVIIMVVIIKGGKSQLTWEFLTSFPEDGMTRGGIFPVIYGTVMMVLIMSLAAVPLGTITAIYLTEYAHEESWVAKSIRFAIRTLAVVPSIIFGLFGLGFFIKFIGAGIDSVFLGGNLVWGQPNILWASLTMALLTLPVVIVSVEESMKNVPQELREASLALGATKWQTIRRIVIPGSLSGIITGSILAVGRGAGEVAPLLFTGAAYYLATLPGTLHDQFMVLGYHIYIMSTQSANVDQTLPIQFATTVVLLGLTFSLNLIAAIIRSYIRRRSK
jgi:phosphate transport system permease protein